jgi:hypothetical protein
LTQRRDDSADHLIANGHGHQPPGRSHPGAFSNFRVVAVEHDRNEVLLEIEDLSDGIVLEQEHLTGHRVWETIDAGNAVAHRKDPPHRDHVELGLVRSELLFQNPGDLTDIDLHRSPCPESPMGLLSDSWF